MNRWNDGAMWVGHGGFVSVHQCGSCRDDYDEEGHWSFEWDHFRSCGHKTEDDAMRAAEEHVIEIAQSMMRQAMDARSIREAALVRS